MNGDRIAWPVAAKLADCLCRSWDETPLLRPARCCVLPGRDVAVDECCPGLAWVRVARVYPTTGEAFPEPAVGGQDTGSWPHSGPAGNCDDTGAWAVALGAGVARCVSGPDDDGTPPSCEELAAAAAVQADDRARVWQAIVCCLAGSGLVSAVAVGDWLPAGPQGGCTGGEWQVTVLVEPINAYEQAGPAPPASLPPTFTEDHDD